jgi:DNA-binding XRE family transcriptional regulator
VYQASLFFLEVSMKDSRIPETVLRAMSEGTHIIRAYREYLGYSIDELAVACGLAAEEIQNIESGLRYNKGYRDRIARSLSLPVGIFEAQSDISDAA